MGGLSPGYLNNRSSRGDYEDLMVYLAPTVMVLLTGDLARGRDNSMITLQVSQDNLSVASFSYRAMGLAGSTNSWAFDRGR
jgi:hypothetical protein